MAFFIFLLKSMMVSSILMLWYWVALRNKVLHQYNRFYLLFTLYASVQIPLLNIHLFSVSEASEQLHHTYTLLQVVNGGGNDEPEIQQLTTWANINWGNVAVYLMLGVSVVLLYRQGMSVYRLWKLSNLYPASFRDGIKIVNTDIPEAPFSFMGTLYWNNAIGIDSDEGQLIYQHELAHLRQWHSVDKLLSNTLSCLLWANPFYKLISRELSIVHEFIADEAAIADRDTAAFARMLLSVHRVNNTSAVQHYFFSSSIKRRITMLQKTSTRKMLATRLLAIPVVTTALLIFSFAPENKTQTADILKASHKLTLVVDAGHGGQDMGTSFGDFKEKDLTLKVAQRMRQLGGAHNIEVKLTRESDVYPTLAQRSELSNSMHPDCFINIHINNDTDKGAGNYRVLISPNSNYDASRKLGSAVINEVAHMLGAKQGELPIVNKNLHVLKNSAVPGIAIELGDIKNERQMNMFANAQAFDALCNSILNGVVLANK